MKRQSFLEVMLTLDHRVLAGHWPEWYGADNPGGLPMKACLKCVKGGHSEKSEVRRRTPVAASG